MAKSFALVKSQTQETPEDRDAPMKARVKEAMAMAGWQRGIIRARRQFADDDRRSALQSAALGYEYEALSLHAMADQHEVAMDNACAELGRIVREQRSAAR